VRSPSIAAAAPTTRPSFHQQPFGLDIEAGGNAALHTGGLHEAAGESLPGTEEILAHALVVEVAQVAVGTVLAAFS